VSGAKIGSKGRPLPGAGRVELGAYDAEHDLILETDRGLVRVPDADEVGVLLAEPRGPIDPTASIKRGVFAPADTWISTEYLFRRDADGDFWLVGRRGAAVRTARGMVFCEPITDALGMIPAVDLAVTYGVPMDGHHVAVAAVTLRPGATITAADLTEAVAAMPFGLGPDVVHVVAEMTLSATYRPTVSALRAAGIPKSGRHVWYFDAEADQFRRLTGTVRAEMFGAQ
jgi:putative long chain acyl-CoA synthase